MNPDRVVQQQAFRHITSAGETHHAVVLVSRDSDAVATFSAGVFMCGYGSDGLPDVGTGVGSIEERLHIKDQHRHVRFAVAQVAFEEIVHWFGTCSFPVAADATLPLTFSPPSPPPLEITFDYAVSAAAIPDARKYLAAHIENARVTKLLDFLAGLDGFPLSVPDQTPFLPVMVSLALAGIGELRRSGVVLAEGQLGSIGRYALAGEDDDDDIEALYQRLELRAPFRDFKGEIGGSSDALVL